MSLSYACARPGLAVRAALGAIKDFFAANAAKWAAAASRLFWRRVPYRYAAAVVSPLMFFVSILNARFAFGETPRTNAAFLLGVNMRRYHHDALWARKKCLEKSMYHCEPHLVAEIKGCGKILNDYVRETCPGRPVLFATMHTVSDRLATVICSLGPAGHVTTISGYADDTLGKGELDIVAAVGTELDRLPTAKLKGPELRHCIKAVVQGRTHLAISPDALPEYTSALAGRPMRTKKIQMFDRPGRLHSGLEVLARASKAVVVYLALHEAEGRLRIDILGRLDWSEIESSEASIIEAAIRKHWRFWLLWHCRSLFYMNPETAYE